MDKNHISAMLDGVDRYPFHMPGHKRNTLLTGNDFPYERDITEISGSDNLHDMSGVILDECNRASRLWGAAKAHLLVNGSTSGLLAAIRALAGHDRAVVVARNCHKSVYNGIELCRLKPTYLYPKMDLDTGICSRNHPAAFERTLNACPLCLAGPYGNGRASASRRPQRGAHKRSLEPRPRVELPNAYTSRAVAQGTRLQRYAAFYDSRLGTRIIKHQRLATANR